jgi:hypothetical protein
VSKFVIAPQSVALPTGSLEQPLMIDISGSVLRVERRVTAGERLGRLPRYRAERLLAHRDVGDAQPRFLHELSPSAF